MAAARNKGCNLRAIDLSLRYAHINHCFLPYPLLSGFAFTCFLLRLSIRGSVFVAECLTPAKIIFICPLSISFVAERWHCRYVGRNQHKKEKEKDGLPAICPTGYSGFNIFISGKESKRIDEYSAIPQNASSKRVQLLELFVNFTPLALSFFPCFAKEAAV